jgi:hypothetical protein
MAEGVIAAEVIPLVIETIPPLIEAVSTLGPVIADVAATAVPLIADVATTAAPALIEAAGTALPAIANVAGEGVGLMSQVAPQIAQPLASGLPQVANIAGQGAPLLSQATAPIASSGGMLSGGGPGLAAPGGVAGSGTFPAAGGSTEVLGSMTSFGPGTQAPFTPAGGPAANMSTAAGPVHTPATSVPSAAAKAEPGQSIMKNKWVKAGFEGLSKMGELGGQDSGGGNRAQGPVHQGSVAPPLNPYKSQHVQAQQLFSKSLMDEYLSGGGVYYG